MKRALLRVLVGAFAFVLTAPAGVAAAPTTPTPTPSGTVVAWGVNYYGQTNVPYGLTGVVAISARGDHTLALKSDGTVVAWGANSSGQTNVPAGLTDVVAVSAGQSHSLALKSDGTVVAWGNNESGQASVPAGLNNIVAISAGWDFSLALKSDGSVVAWGYWSAIDVPAGLTDVVAIAAGTGHSLALKSNGTVVAWGNNASGQTDVPAGLSGVVAISASTHSLALRSDGTVVGWGYNRSGQATPPDGLTGVTAIAAGLYHSLALKSDGTIVTWGENDNGEGTPPPGIYGVKAIAGAAGYSVAIAAGVNDPTPRPPNDDWDGATTVTGVPYQLTESTSDATTASDDDFFYSKKTVWFSFTPSTDRRVAISTIGSDYQTDVAVYTGMRDSRGYASCDYPISGVQWCNVAAGTTYHIVVSAAYGAGGNLVFSVLDIPTIELTIDNRVLIGHPSSPSAVRVSGTVVCSEPMTLSFEAWFIQGNASSAASGQIGCSSTMSSWTVDVPDYGYFTPGAGTATMSAGGSGVAGPVYASVGASVLLTRYDQALVADLIALVNSYGLGKLGASLTDKLITVQRMLEANKRNQAIETVDSFISQVKAQKGKGLTIQQATELTNRAQEIRSAIS
jgi:hypothetical protein